MIQPLIDKEYLLEKIAGKGGWTYAKIPEIPQDKQKPFGLVRVRGTIDHYGIEGYHLMPFGNGQLFLPLKAEIRKKIKKQAGDTVHVVLYADDLPTEIPEELVLCLKHESDVYERFLAYSNAEQKSIIAHIYSAKTEQTKADRILKLMNKISKAH